MTTKGVAIISDDYHTDPANLIPVPTLGNCHLFSSILAGKFGTVFGRANIHHETTVNTFQSVISRSLLELREEMFA